MSLLGRRLQYRINRAFAQGSSLLYAGLALIAAAVVLFGANAYFFGLFSAEALEAEGIANDIDGGFWDSLLWSLKHVIDPGAFAEDYGAPPAVLVIAFVISLLGLVIFGTLVGFIASLVQRRIENIERGNTPVFEQGHTLVLGWNTRTPAVLRRLAEQGRRVTVVLAPVERAQMQQALLREGLTRHRSDFVLRTGSPSRMAEMRSVALRAADSILVFGSRAPDGSIGEPDVEVIKTLLLLASIERDGEAGLNVVAEIQDEPNFEIARIASRGRVPIVTSTEVIGRLVVQSVRYPGLARVYAHLFAAGTGAIHVRHVEGLAGRRFGDVMFEISGGLPIGISWSTGQGDGRRTAVALNPEPDYELDDDESLVVLSTREKFTPARRSAPEGSATLTAPSPRANDARLERVLILGWNRTVSEILKELDAHARAPIHVQIAANLDPEEMGSRLDALLERSPAHLVVECTRHEIVRRSDIESIDPESFDCLFVVASDRGTERDPDAGTILTLLLLGDRLERRTTERRPRVVAEIREARNRELLADSVADDIVVSPEVLSVLITQISRLPVLGPVYRELLSAEGIEIGLRPALAYAPADTPTPFAHLVASGQRALEIVMGVMLAPDEEGDEPTIVLAPDLDEVYWLDADDRLIVLAQQVYA